MDKKKSCMYMYEKKEEREMFVWRKESIPRS